MQKSIVFILMLSLISFPLFAQETFTLTTYYPAPFGAYQQLRVHGQMAVGDADGDGDVDAADFAVYPPGHPRAGQVIEGSLTVGDRIGVGTTQPRGGLHIDRPGSNVSALIGPLWNNGVSYNPGNQRLGIFAWGGSSGLSLAENNVGGYLIENAGSALTFKAGYDGSIGERVRFNSDGNVGIGVTAPQSKLDVNGGVKIGDVANNGCTAQTAGTLRYHGGKIQYCHANQWQDIMPLRTVAGTFCNVTQWAKIPNSDDAVLCALSGIDDDTDGQRISDPNAPNPTQKCEIRYNGNVRQWQYGAPLNCGLVTCQYICLSLR